MPQMTPEFSVNCPIDQVWEHISDMENIGNCIPDCSVRVVDDETSIWSIKVALGLFSKTIRLTNNVLERDEATHHVEFEAKGDGITAHGDGQLEKIDENTTQVNFTLSIAATGLGAGMINSVIAQTMDEGTQAFIENAKAALED